MADISATIRQSLETKLSQISGLPTIAYENTDFKPTVGTPFVMVRLMPTGRRAAVTGPSPQQRYDGILAVDCYNPEGVGPAAADAIAAKVLDAFDAATSVDNITIEYAERDRGVIDGSWYVVPVNIGWHVYA